MEKKLLLSFRLVLIIAFFMEKNSQSIWNFNIKKPNSKLVRWPLKLSDNDYKIVNKNAKYNNNAGAWSCEPNNVCDYDRAGAK